MFPAEMRAVVVELAFDADLDVADAKFRAQLYVVPNEGVVAEVRHEDVLILGILPRRSDETVVRVERSASPSGSRASETPDRDTRFHPFFAADSDRDSRLQ